MKTAVKLLVVIALVAVAVALLALAGLFRLPYPPIRWPYPLLPPWLNETAVLTVVKIQGECVVVDVPVRLVTKPGRSVEWHIRARPNECTDHVVSIQFIGAGPTKPFENKKKVALGEVISAGIKEEEDLKEKLDDGSSLYIYEIRLESDAKIMGRGTLAECPDWPCKAARIYVDETPVTATGGATTTPPTTLSPPITTPPIR